MVLTQFHVYDRYDPDKYLLDILVEAATTALRQDEMAGYEEIKLILSFDTTQKVIPYC